MQRIIKFRGKRVDNGEWFYGSYHYSADNKHHYILNLEKFNERSHPNGVKGMDEMCLFKSEVTTVDPATVGQFTGLTDKNGKEIYEGDILKEYYSRGYVYKVFSVQGGFAINTHQDDLAKDNIVFYNSLADMQNSGYINQCTEVIGNIHENPELCKG